MSLVIYMRIDKIFDKFIESVRKEGIYASRDEIRESCCLMLDLIKNNKDCTPEELVEFVINDNVKFVNDIREKYYFPGFTIGINVGNINVKLLGGNLYENGPAMNENALFDIASISKFYTQIIIYNLVKEKFFKFNSKIYDLDDRFINLKDLTVGDITSFGVRFMTNGRINEKNNLSDAYNTLFSVNVVESGKYNYNDIGMMIMKEVMERVTGLSYKELVDKYIVSKFGLSNTHLIVPIEKRNLITGTSNINLASVNDSGANALGGYSGHAGIFTSSDDLIKLTSAVTSGKVIDKKRLNDVYSEGLTPGRGKMGNVYVSSERGSEVSYVGRLEPKRTFALQGSTRANVNANSHSSCTVLLNPASMSIERALENEAKINAARAIRGEAPLSLVKRFNFNRDGSFNQYNLIDVRQMLPSGKTVDPLIAMNAKLVLRLRFLDEFIKEYYRNYEKQIDVVRKIG